MLLLGAWQSGEDGSMPEQAKSVESSHDEEKLAKQKRQLLEETSRQDPYAGLAQAYLGASRDAPTLPGTGLLNNPNHLTAQRQALAVRIGCQQGNQTVSRMLLQDDRPPQPSHQESAAQSPSSTFTPPPTRSIEVVRPVVHPNPNLQRTVQAPRQPAGLDNQTALEGDKLSVESLQVPKAPVMTEDQKISYAAASTPVLNDITPSGSSGLTTIKFAEIKIEAKAIENGTTGDWIILVSDASTTIHWGINTSGYKIPNPVDGGNITRTNYRYVIDQLKGYEARQYSGTWHHPDASSAHEQVHVAWYSAQIKSNWPAIQARIDAKVLGNKSSMTKEQADTAMRAYLEEERRKWFDSYGLAPEPEAYAVGQGVLNQKIKEIENYVASKGENP
jgi:hypothetical protein